MQRSTHRTGPRYMVLSTPVSFRLFLSVLSFLFLHSAAAATVINAKPCRADRDCPRHLFCSAVTDTCSVRLKVGFVCGRDRQCLSDHCEFDAHCRKTSGRAITGGIIAATIIAIIFVVVLVSCTTFCCVKKCLTKS